MANEAIRRFENVVDTNAKTDFLYHLGIVKVALVSYSPLKAPYLQIWNLCHPRCVVPGDC